MATQSIDHQFPEYPCEGRVKLALEWLPKGGTVLDAGCAYGSATRHFYAKCDKVCGLDIDKELISVAKKRYPQISFRQGPLEEAPYRDSSFDAVVCSDVLEHVDDEVLVLNELCRVIKLGGVLIITVPHKGLFGWLDPANYLYRARRFLGGRLEDIALGPVNPGNLHRHYSLSELQNLLNDGFVVKRVFRSGLFIQVFTEILRVPISRLFGSKSSLLRPLEWLSALDYRIPYGPLAYNIAILAKKPNLEVEG